ncbi:hypothetical protein [Gordonia alkanivorans]|uniref:hypothetical protein n=1 Tax=Gordonia alkanivorans TaxID=84096 RepID=UPI002446BA5C|nr:hypothetical protein [Gordonia alkanivorans]MDH3045350.1 hypothetical protein [Gordonia alkanivorans]
MIDELPEYLRAEGIGTEVVYFREPGGMGFGLETVALFAASGVIGGAAWAGTQAAAKAVIDWSRERIRRYREGRADELLEDEDPPVRVTIYGPNGAMLRAIEVRHSGVDDPFGDADQLD